MYGVGYVFGCVGAYIAGYTANDVVDNVCEYYVARVVSYDGRYRVGYTVEWRIDYSVDDGVGYGVVDSIHGVWVCLCIMCSM